MEKNAVIAWLYDRSGEPLDVSMPYFEAESAISLPRAGDRVQYMGDWYDVVRYDFPERGGSRRMIVRKV